MNSSQPNSAVPLVRLAKSRVRFTQTTFWIAYSAASAAANSRRYSLGSLHDYVQYRNDQTTLFDDHRRNTLYDGIVRRHRLCPPSRPHLKKHCLKCHGGKEAEGGFSINSRSSMIDGGAVAGDSSESRFIQLVRSTDPDDQMPPKEFGRLTAKEVNTLVTWVDQKHAVDRRIFVCSQRIQTSATTSRSSIAGRSKAPSN